jgi:hypothetical protein
VRRRTIRLESLASGVGGSSAASRYSQSIFALGRAFANRVPPGWTHLLAVSPSPATGPGTRQERSRWHPVRHPARWGSLGNRQITRGQSWSEGSLHRRVLDVCKAGDETLRPGKVSRRAGQSFAGQKWPRVKGTCAPWRAPTLRAVATVLLTTASLALATRGESLPAGGCAKTGVVLRNRESMQEL